uniref:Phosphatidylinositol-glycan biosynthesis class X protein n=1 Tax=Acrobeloides nanus TaxID=290746 RepID=A0A914CRZ3_9BILA
MNDISFDDVNFQIRGEGFHRTLETSFKITNKQRFVNCRLAYRYRLPKGAYLDSNTIGSDLSKHCFTPSHFDVEAPESSPKVANFHPVYFHSLQVLRKLFVFGDKVDIPVHLRYHKPAENDQLEAIVTFEFPKIYIQCEDNATTIFKETACEKNMEKIPCGCESHMPKCEFLRINMPNPRTVSASIPIASGSHRIFVIFFTLFMVSTCIACTFYIVYNSKAKHE